MKLPNFNLLLYGSGAFFLSYAATSLVWSHDPAGGAAWLVTMLIAFYLGRRIFSFLWLGATLAWVASILVLVNQIDMTLNPNFLGCALALAIAAFAAEERFFFMVLPAPFLYLTQSRTAILAAGVAYLLGICRRFPATAICLSAWIIALAAWTKTGSIDSLWVRLGIWNDTLEHLPAYGYGFGFEDFYKSWSVHRNIGYQTATHAYSDPLELIAMYGLGTVFLWVFLAVLFRRARYEQVIFCATFGVLSLTYFPLFIPIVGHSLAFVLGNITKESENALPSRCRSLR